MEEIRLFIESVITTHLPAYTFQYGRTEDINTYARNVDQLAWLFPMNVGTGTNQNGKLQRTFNIAVAFFGIDKMSNDNVRQMAIIESRFKDAEEFIIQMYFDSLDLDIEPLKPYSTGNIFLKSANGLFTGVQINFSISAPDNYEIC
jgi:hypothetical protein